MPRDLSQLINLLDLEQIEVNLFRGHNPSGDAWTRVFGGQVIGQALVAAQRTVEDVVCHSLHAYFLRAGDPKVPIIYEVDRARDGRSFKSRRVTAVQHGKQIFNLAASFQSEEKGLEHAAPMPDVPPPDGLKSDYELRAAIAEKIPQEYRAHFLREPVVEIRPIDPVDKLKPQKSPPRNALWFRANQAEIGDAYAIHQCILAYMSDMSLLDSCLRPHGETFMNPKLQVASLDHAMWFHQRFRADEWLLYVQDSPRSSGARGLNFGHVYTQSGALVCSVAQEGLIRLHD